MIFVKPYLFLSHSRNHLFQDLEKIKNGYIPPKSNVFKIFEVMIQHYSIMCLFTPKDMCLKCYLKCKKKAGAHRCTLITCGF